MHKILTTILTVFIFSLSANAESVVFNTKSLKYHSPSCQYAKKCTQNCIKVEKSDAVKRGGVPCKVCGGK